ncbi:hypothetical protein CLV63_13018 [Murinocardiopsis flavida]|uniref:Uncharacterized protein n=1 Tax=Murinocardiopsis flavida TaxID=645275 RepID=A0A2P8CSW0_9ACTN|nr:hypothetical protein CLV63_13018 [Murinocardiopsis flavida]
MAGAGSAAQRRRPPRRNTAPDYRARPPPPSAAPYCRARLPRRNTAADCRARLQPPSAAVESCGRLPPPSAATDPADSVRSRGDTRRLAGVAFRGGVPPSGRRRTGDRGGRLVGVQAEPPQRVGPDADDGPAVPAPVRTDAACEIHGDLVTLERRPVDAALAQSCAGGRHGMRAARQVLVVRDGGPLGARGVHDVHDAHGGAYPRAKSREDARPPPHRKRPRSTPQGRPRTPGLNRRGHRGRALRSSGQPPTGESVPRPSRQPPTGESVLNLSRQQPGCRKACARPYCAASRLSRSGGPRRPKHTPHYDRRARPPHNPRQTPTSPLPALSPSPSRKGPASASADAAAQAQRQPSPGPPRRRTLSAPTPTPTPARRGENSQQGGWAVVVLVGAPFRQNHAPQNTPHRKPPSLGRRVPPTAAVRRVPSRRSRRSRRGRDPR